jgi:CheY-like chemotaxis protein
MIVDDINFNILVLKKLINSNNVRYIEAHDGAEAIAKLNNDKPDLIFMDIRMPGMNGYEVTDYIKNLKEHRQYSCYCIYSFGNSSTTTIKLNSFSTVTCKNLYLKKTLITYFTSFWVTL